ncbi:uncharacterized protein MONOS_9108 [Monocercomonoides exilis]|uniref:uncharacterized protein n=1 Tax=Monocercomonoides exilis TaxID=2049356 RepID=UPI00355981F0|nr:hypothetical protein MONOS_9108 [Monocercomonoides exilis]|eukprot:MONOS_9108.1-p1 / transcript=MONOS_9108.1 / gene=MONOS_9108 / organism=Monocercomonoides_exilis_PA203 / gene_product=unspecified product / transcript_product=unspecified product / location=Mono_scaffold00365:26388-28589(+) / protein_length=734 / sequence_SO=supercontig / SO=protein_coding / is_pseudo=false
MEICFLLTALTTWCFACAENIPCNNLHNSVAQVLKVQNAACLLIESDHFISASIPVFSSKLNIRGISETTVSMDNSKLNGPLFLVKNSTLKLESVNFTFEEGSVVAEVSLNGSLLLSDCSVLINTVLNGLIISNGGYTEMRNISFIFQNCSPFVETVILNGPEGGSTSMIDSTLTAFAIVGRYPFLENENSQRLSMHNCHFRNSTYSNRALELSFQQEKSHYQTESCNFESNTFEGIENAFYGGLVHGLFSESFVSLNSSYLFCKWNYKKHKTEKVNATLKHDTFSGISNAGCGGALTVEGAGGILKVIDCKFEGCVCKPSVSSLSSSTKGHSLTTGNDDSEFDGCGGGICVASSFVSSVLSVENSSFVNCSAGNNGGGICFGERFVLSGSTFTVCSATNGRGGGCIINSAALSYSIDNCTFDRCTSGSSSSSSSSFVTLHLMASGAFESLGGGGICFDSLVESVLILSCTFTSCSANVGRGGAVLLSGTPKSGAGLKFSHCTFHTNTAGEHGQDVAADSTWENELACKGLFTKCESNSQTPKFSIGEDDKDDSWIGGKCNGADPDSDPKPKWVTPVVAAVIFVAVVALCMCCGACGSRSRRSTSQSNGSQSDLLNQRYPSLPIRSYNDSLPPQSASSYSYSTNVSADSAMLLTARDTSLFDAPYATPAPSPTLSPPSRSPQVILPRLPPHISITPYDPVPSAPPAIPSTNNLVFACPPTVDPSLTQYQSSFP